MAKTPLLNFLLEDAEKRGQECFLKARLKPTNLWLVELIKIRMMNWGEIGVLFLWISKSEGQPAAETQSAGLPRMRCSLLAVRRCRGVQRAQERVPCSLAVSKETSPTDFSSAFPAGGGGEAAACLATGAWPPPSDPGRAAAFLKCLMPGPEGQKGWQPSWDAEHGEGRDEALWCDMQPGGIPKGGHGVAAHPLCPVLLSAWLRH